jgi:hypothetical protein
LVAKSVLKKGIHYGERETYSGEEAEVMAGGGVSPLTDNG